MVNPWNILHTAWLPIPEQVQWTLSFSVSHNNTHPLPLGAWNSNSHLIESLSQPLSLFQYTSSQSSFSFQYILSRSSFPIQYSLTQRLAKPRNSHFSCHGNDILWLLDGGAACSQVVKEMDTVKAPRTEKYLLLHVNLTLITNLHLLQGKVTRMILSRIRVQ